LRSHGGDEVHHRFQRALRVNRNRLVDATNYWRQIKVYIDLYGAENILILFFEDFQTNQSGELRRCFEHLGVAPDFQLPDGQLHVAPSEKLRLERAGLSQLRRIPFFRSAVKLIPRTLKQPIRERFFHAPAPRPIWTESSRRWVLDILGEDSEQILRYCGKPLGYWNLNN
jgi:hypothetical protein